MLCGFFAVECALMSQTVICGSFLYKILTNSIPYIVPQKTRSYLKPCHKIIGFLLTEFSAGDWGCKSVTARHKRQMIETTHKMAINSMC